MIKTIAILEIKKISKSPLIWVFLSCVTLVLGVVFQKLIAEYLTLSHEDVLLEFRHTGVTRHVIQPYLGWSLLIVSLIIPLLSMNAISQEKKDGTFFLWATSGLKARQIIIGKYLAYSFYIITSLLIALIMPITLVFEGSLDYGLLFSGMIGIALLNLSFLSIGFVASALTPHPSVAAGATLISCIALMFIEWLNPLGEGMGTVANKISLLNHSFSLLNGYLNSVDIGYYLIFIATCLTLATRALHHKAKRL